MELINLLIMIRIALVPREVISIFHFIPGRIRLSLYRPHDIYIVYEYDLNSGGN